MADGGQTTSAEGTAPGSWPEGVEVGTADDACRYLRVAPWTLPHLIRKHGLPVDRVGVGRDGWRFSREALRKWVEKGGTKGEAIEGRKRKRATKAKPPTA
jgi:excisionase family DNA binding protein